MLKEGIVNFLKPAGMTSHDAVYLMRRVFGVKRVGHTGTLDPMAAGVLPLGIGSATRVTEYLDLDEKTYRCQVLLGLSTDTLDVWGTVLQDRREVSKTLREEAVAEALLEFEGNIMQLPPKYSALKVDGKRLYEYARSGQEVEISRRPVSISRISPVDMDLSQGRVTFDVTCSKGTYIRSICQELGEKLGCCGGAMSFLLRKQSGVALLEKTVTVEELKENSQHPEALIGGVDEYIPSLGKLCLRKGRGVWFTNGGYLVDYDIVDSEEPYRRERQQDEAGFLARFEHLSIRKDLLETYRVYEDGRFLGTAILDRKNNKYICDKVFYR